MEKFDFFFKSNGKDKLLRHDVTYDEAWVAMREFLSEHNFNSPYIRVWTVKGITRFDVGSHTEHFFLKKI